MSVDMFGLDEFGAPTGPSWGAFGGALGGGLLASGTAVLVQEFLTGWEKWAEGIGLLVGSATGAVLAFASENTRGMGYACIASAMAATLPRQIQHLMSKKQQMLDMAAKQGLSLDTTGKGVVVTPLPAETTTGWGRQAVEQLRGQAVEQLNGAPLAAGSGALARHAAASQVVANGGPQISGLAAHFGATVFGDN